MKPKLLFIAGGVALLGIAVLVFEYRRRAEGAQLYREFGCGACHGEQVEGSGRGPELRGLSAHWQSATLATYLRDPAAARVSDERLRLLSQRYFPLSMPAFEDLQEAHCRALADYLLQH